MEMRMSNYLGDAKEAQQIGHLKRHFAVGAADDAGNHLAAVLWSRRRLVLALESGRLHGVYGCANELQRLVECVSA